VIAVFAALQPEVGACLGCFPQREESTIAGYPAVRSDIATVIRTGMGRRAQESVEAALPELSPSAVLSVGVAGGLHAERRAGEIILCQRVDHAETRGGASAGMPATSDAALIDAALATASELGLPARVGTAVTLDSVAWTPEEKADLHGWLEHDVVEMESYWIGRAANERGLPYLAVRVVSDQAGDQLVDSGAITQDGSFDQQTFLAFIKERPELMPMFSEQMERNRRAFASLTAFLTAFLPRVEASLGTRAAG
jgi:nucleoside phosphorylase